MEKLLLVDDDQVILDSLVFNFQREGFTVLTAMDGATALAVFDNEKPDLVVLDIRMPVMDGIEVCRRLRASSSIPIILLTALDSEIDKVAGLEGGADDYIAKPFSFRELLARVNSLFRRIQLDHQPEVFNGYQIDSLRMDLTRHRLYKNDQEIQLSNREFELLALLMSQPGKAISREDIIRTVWGSDWDRNPGTLEVHIRWLRLKIEDKPPQPKYIQTIRGYGYRFKEPEKTELQ